LGWNDFSLAAVGCWYENDDGSSRQDELRQCMPGDGLEFVREPDNPHDHLAVAIVTSRGVKVGYLGRERSGWIASKLDRGYSAQVIVERVKGLHMEGATLGLVMRISLDCAGSDLAAAE
jgi:hypothetical protein